MGDFGRASKYSKRVFFVGKAVSKDRTQRNLHDVKATKDEGCKEKEFLKTRRSEESAKAGTGSC